MSQRHSIAGFDMRHAPSTDPIHRILASTLSQPVSKQADRSLGLAPMLSIEPTRAIAAETQSPYWDATYFGLDRVQIFQASTPAEQQAILHRASQALIQETYCIEKAGMGYMSRMALLAETLEERMLYTLFAAEETTHFAQICPFLDHEPDAIANPFLQLLSTVVECDDTALLVFVIQVVLEGWGLTHYRFLANDCLNHELRQRFHGFLRDESRHHGTGVTLFNQHQLTDSSRADIVDVLVQFLQMVQVGPQAVVEAIAQIKGHLSRAQRIQILGELDTETHSGGRLRLLRSLIQKGEGWAIAQRLDQLNVFQPLSAHQCA